MSSVIEELGEHLAQWSYSVAFFELSFIPGVRLRSFCKCTKVDRFRKDMRELIRQIEANSEFTNKKRATISCLPSDPATSSFLEEEKESGASPLSKYVATLRQRAQKRNDTLTDSSILYGAEPLASEKDLEESDEENDVGDEGEAVFSSFYSQQKETGVKLPKEEKKNKNKKKLKGNQQEAMEDDIVQDFVLSSDEEDEPMDDDNDDSPLPEETVKPEKGTRKRRNKKKPANDGSMKNARISKEKKRKRSH